MDGSGRQGQSESVSIITLLVTLIVIGVIMWLINSFIPMQGTIKRILNAIVVICVVIWLLQVFGLIGTIRNFQVPQLR
jgi:uncharacterized membrane protein YwzB